MNGDDDLVCLSTNTEKCLEKLYEDNLMCKRDNIKYISFEPRKYDIIYVYEIVDYVSFMNLFRHNNYINFKKHAFNESYTRKEIFKQVFERLEV